MEQLSPARLVDVMNAVFFAMTGAVEAHGGFVTQYVEDAVVAIFGVPIDHPGHGRRGVESMLACRERLAALAPSLDLSRGQILRFRFGINSGEVVVGNIGSRKRLNYSVVGTP